MSLTYDFPAKRDCMENFKQCRKFMGLMDGSEADFLISELCFVHLEKACQLFDLLGYGESRLNGAK